MTLAMLVRHYAPVPRGKPHEIVEQRLRRAFPALSAREAEVCALTMVGWSSPRIAARLGIASGSVLTFRRRAYTKTGVSSAGELVSFILT